MKDALERKNKSLKLAIERYNTYKTFIEKYKTTKSLDEYVTFITGTFSSLSESLVEHYEKMIYHYKNGNSEPLLSNLYDRLLAADEYKQKVTEELKSLLREL
jgi:histone acetyltransferase (RNA polymerase elongator complex component)